MATPDVGTTLETLVIGYGNEWRGDDGVGPFAARQIESLHLPNVRTVSVPQLLPELAEALSTVAQVVFIDACREPQATPVLLSPLAAQEVEWLTTHIVDPRALVELSRILYGRAPQAWLVTIAGDAFTPGEGISAAARRHAEEAVHRIAQLLK